MKGAAGCGAPGKMRAAGCAGEMRAPAGNGAPGIRIWVADVTGTEFATGAAPACPATPSG